MRREHERLFQTGGVHYLQHHIKGMTMQLIGVMHLDELRLFLAFISQRLQSLRERTLTALRQSYDSDFNHDAKLLLFFDLYNT